MRVITHRTLRNLSCVHATGFNDRATVLLKRRSTAAGMKSIPKKRCSAHGLSDNSHSIAFTGSILRQSDAPKQVIPTRVAAQFIAENIPSRVICDVEQEKAAARMIVLSQIGERSLLIVKCGVHNC